MQTYPFNITPAASRTFGATGDLFVYESGQGAGEGADTRIIVKPDSGGEITLRPGQQFRLPTGEKATQWNMRAVDVNGAVTGSVIIGAGEFHDANTLNKVQLDATFANVVTVANTAAERVPVSLDPNQLLQQAGPALAYNVAKKVLIQDNRVAATTTIISAAENQNGVVIEQISGPSSYRVEIRANDALLNVVPTAQVFDRTRIKVPAGQAIVGKHITAGYALEVEMLFTVL